MSTFPILNFMEHNLVRLAILKEHIFVKLFKTEKFRNHFRFKSGPIHRL